MIGKVIYTWKTTYSSIWYDGKMMEFAIGKEYDLPIERCVELIRTGKFIPGNSETFERIKSMYCSIKYKPVEGMLTGQDCYIIGSGGSLKNFDFDKIYGKGFILAVNHSAKYCKSDGIIFLDEKFYYQSKEFLQNYKGIIFASWQSNYWKNAQTQAIIYNFTSKTQHIYDNRLNGEYYKGLYDLANTGLCAVHLALIMNARNIYLLGFDMDWESTDEKHFYNEDGIDLYDNSRQYYYEMKCKPVIERHAQYFGCFGNIYNCNPASKITCYKYYDITKVVAA